MVLFAYSDPQPKMCLSKSSTDVQQVNVCDMYCLYYSYVIQTKRVYSICCLRDSLIWILTSVIETTSGGETPMNSYKQLLNAMKTQSEKKRARSVVA